MHSKVYDACAGAACVFFGVSLAELDLVVQIIAGILASIAAFITIYGHFRKWLARRKGND